MSNLGALLKVNLQENLDFRKFKKEKAKTTGFFVVITLAILGGLALSTLYNFVFGEFMLEANVDLSNLFVMMLGFAAFLTFTTVIFKAKSIFTGKDFEMLSAMPLKRSSIIASKIIGLYLIELIYSSIIMLPCGVISTIFSSNAMYILEGIICAIVAPAIPIALGCLFALFIAFIADRFKFANVITVILYSILLISVMAFSFVMNYANPSTGQGLGAFTTMVDVMAWINPVNQLYVLAHSTNYLFFFAFVGANILVILLTVLFISLSYMSIYESINSLSGGNKYERKTLKVEGQRKALLKNEFKRYFKSKMYFLNTISSGIAAIACSIFITLIFTPSFNSGESGIEEFQPILKQYGSLGALLIMFMIGISTPATCGISIEGPNFWLIKSLPINYKSYCKNKIVLSVTVLGVCSLIASTAMVVILQPSIMSIITIYVYPLIFVFFSSSMGLFINLYFNKLKWNNEQEVVKNGASIWMTMIFDMLSTILIGGGVIALTLLLPVEIGTIVGPCVGMAVTLIFGIVFYVLVMKVCEKQISKIEEF